MRLDELIEAPVNNPYWHTYHVGRWRFLLRKDYDSPPRVLFNSVTADGCAAGNYFIYSDSEYYRNVEPIMAQAILHHIIQTEGPTLGPTMGPADRETA